MDVESNTKVLGEIGAFTHLLRMIRTVERRRLCVAQLV